jgi:hypothetical protein
MRACKCGCGEAVKNRRVFVNKEHQLMWMHAGGAREMNALLPDEVRQQGGRTAGKQLAASGQLQEAAKKGGARSREIAAKVRAKTIPR